MLAIEKALFVSLCSGLSSGYRWRGKLTEPVADEKLPSTVLLDARQLAELEALYRQEDDDAVVIVRSLEARADAVLAEPILSVTDKTGVSEEGEANDYRSLAKYWWPNPDSDNGLPYVRRDGEVNPDCYDERYDARRLIDMAESLQVLSLATWFTRKDAYRERAVAQLEAWFADTETRQSPHFRYAQTIPGHSDLRSPGLIEARHLIYVTEAVLLLESASALPATLSATLREWFGALLRWFREQDKGIGAGRAHNNIALWYDLQCLAYAWFVGDEALARYIVTDVAVVRRHDQIDLDGSLPAELDRANPLDYVTFTVAAMSQLSRYGDAMGVPIWHQTDGDGRSFQRAHDWLLQQAQAQESREAGQRLLVQSGAEMSSTQDAASSLASSLTQDGGDDLVLQLGLLNRLNEARRRMLEARDVESRRQTTRISELERELASRDKQLKTLKQGKEAQRDMENDKQMNARLEWLEKELVRAREARIKELHDVIERQQVQARDVEKQRELQQKVKEHKEKLSALESRFNDARRQFDTQLAETSDAKRALADENARLVSELKQQQSENQKFKDENQKLKEKQSTESEKSKAREKRLNELLKSNEREMEKLLKAFRERPKTVTTDDAKSREEIKKLKQELRSHQRKIGRLQETADRQRSRADYFKERSDKILSSRSWRLTGALRKLTGGGSGKKR
ncbi:alginate lyase family protein [Salinicola halophilus]|uniref:alginate lyase family protein n=1 Tax=Salinicola halophilus TaxID=184065 RepID=UPI000DA16DCE|nr:alginate lyase family protein [Salinicola halophilus]